MVEALKGAEGEGCNIIKWPGDVRVSTLGLPEEPVDFVKDPDRKYYQRPLSFGM